MLDLMQRIKDHYELTGKKMPEDADTAVMWVTTEIGEAFELLLARQGGWTRNNPQNKKPYSDEALVEELGDVIMMCMVAAISEGLHSPIDAMTAKMDRKECECRQE